MRACTYIPAKGIYVKALLNTNIAHKYIFSGYLIDAGKIYDLSMIANKSKIRNTIRVYCALK